MVGRIESRVLTVAVIMMGLAGSLQAQDADALKQQARALVKQGDYAKAIPVFDRAMAAATRSYGANDQRTDVIVNELAAAYFSQKRYREAEPLFQRVLKNTEARRGPQDTEVATALNNLGALYNGLGNYPRAEATYLRSYQILTAALGPNHPDLATNYNNLASVYHNLGDDARSLSLYRQSLQLYESATPKDELLVANSLNNLAAAHIALSQPEQAEPLYRRALQIRESRLGSEHPSVAITLNNLASLLQDQKRYDLAEPLYLRSMKIREKKFGADHPDVATTLNNLASLFRKQGRFADAEKFHLRALEIREAKLGKTHPLVASSLNNLAGLYKDMDQDERAVPLYQRSLSIRQARNGGDHPDVAQSFNNLGFLHAKLGNWKDAAAGFDQSRRIVRKHVSQILPTLSEPEQLAFLKGTDEHYLHGALSLALQRRDDPGVAELSASWVLNAKGVSQQAISQRIVQARDLGDPAVAPGVEKLQEIRRDLVRLSRSADETDGAERLKRVAQLREEEQKLARQVAEATGRPVQDSLWVELADVRRALTAGTVLVEIARFRNRDFRAKAGDEARWQSPHYAAWIIPKQDAGEVKLLDLGEAEPIEKAVRDVREALVAAPEAIRTEGEPDAEQQLLARLQALAQVTLHPIATQFGSAENVVLSLDALLWLVPWSALPLPDKTYAIEKYKLTLVVSGRDVAVPPYKTKLGPAVIVADPNYDLGPAESITAIKALFRGRLPARLFSKVRPAIEMPTVARLPGTAAEAQAIMPKLESYTGKPPLKYTAEYALEGMLKNLRQPQVLVLSTHGFFREDQVVNGEDEEQSGGRIRRGKPLENPLLRCGLLLAGSNSRELAALEEADDGVLTGLEVVSADLRGTELVVLSACETGLGEVRTGEGVAGLRQAFQLAGSQAVLATLWEIPDAQTARLMSDFFTNLSDGKGNGDALRQAQLKMIEARRERGGAAHPFFWAAFTLTGRP